MAIFDRDMAQRAGENDCFRTEVYLDEIVLTSPVPGEEIGMETHCADQTAFLTAGHGHAVIDGAHATVTPDRMIVILEGAEHDIIDTGDAALASLSIHAPPAGPAGVAHRAGAGAEAAGEGFVSRAARRLRAAVIG